ncbi:helix-turn-helix transcriptional regulator [Nocardiopsis sp. CC223A]|uniref:helix-turn-helix transcriptional regulator n=1 Tax=Nocardiopsis sp. CC223A TaxID=3044051 RepID=UPI00278C0A0A|nr:helix-turn-helix transcriptional regulator [Nocardiopsis sp. CC223A]
MTPTPTAFIGRGPDLAHLLAETDLAARGDARTTLVLGDAGVGKTRLLDEYLRRTPLPRTAVGACLETSGGTVAFAPFTAALRHLVREIPPSPARAGALARLLPELGAAAPDEDRTRLFEAVLSYLEDTAADAGGLSLVIEDLHWADASTRDLLLFLVRNLGPAPVHLLATVRTDDLHRTHPLRRLLPDLERPVRATRLDLEPFDREEVAAQAAALRGGARPDPRTLDLLCERSGGNPLFVEALVSAPEDGLPGTSRDLLLRAVDRLPDTDRAVLGLAALSGVRVHHALLEAVAADLSEDDLDGVLRRAVDARVLRVAGEDYGFGHALLAEAVRGDLLPGQRVRGHRRYVTALEAGVPGLAEPERVLLLAHHADAVHDHPRAFAALWAAAGHAADAFAHPEHLVAVKRLLELWELLPDPESVAAPPGVTRGRLLLDAARAAVQTGGSSHEALRYTEEGAAAEADPVARAGFLLLRSQALKALHRRNEGLEALDEASALLPQGHPDHIAVSGARAALLYLVGRDVEAGRAAREVLDRARAAGDRRSEAEALITLGSALEVGREDGSLPLLTEGMGLARELGMVDAELRARNNIAVHHLYRLEWHECLQAERDLLDRCAELGVLRTRGPVPETERAGALLDLGRMREAEEVLVGFSGGRLDEGTRRFVLAEIRLAQRDIAGAREHWERSAAAVRGTDAHLYAAVDQLGLRVLTAEGDLVAALETAHRMIARERGGQPTQSSLNGLGPVAGLVRALRRAGRVEEAGELAGQAGVFLRPSSWWTTPYGELRRSQARARLAAEPAEALEHWERALGMVRGRGLHSEEFLLLEETCRAAAEAGEGARARALFGELEEGVGLLDTDAPLRERYVEPLRPVAGEPRLPAGLTPREAEVLRHAAAGLTNTEIGEKLFISAKTVSVHMSNLMGKLGVGNRHAAGVRARELGLTPPAG